MTWILVNFLLAAHHAISSCEMMEIRGYLSVQALFCVLRAAGQQSGWDKPSLRDCMVHVEGEPTQTQQNRTCGKEHEIQGRKLITTAACSSFSNASVQSLSHMWLPGQQHARPPCPSPSPRACLNSYPLSRWCHQTILFSVSSFSFCLQSFPASGSFLMSQFFTSVLGQSLGVSASASVLPVNIQGWFPWRLTGLISL